jgi:uncharacterized damage-inducible protein DinB
MTPEQASFLLEIFLAGIKKEAPITRRVILAVPDDKSGYRPDPNSRSALELAWHIASSDVWFLEAFLKGNFDMEDDSMPADLANASDIASWHEDNLATSFEKIAKLSPNFWATPLNCFGIYNFPAVLYLQFMLVHTVHHRGQLCAYLRPMGSKVPNIYGGSFDEPMVMPPNG